MHNQHRNELNQYWVELQALHEQLNTQQGSRCVPIQKELEGQNSTTEQVVESCPTLVEKQPTEDDKFTLLGRKK